MTVTTAEVTSAGVDRLGSGLLTEDWRCVGNAVDTAVSAAFGAAGVLSSGTGPAAEDVSGSAEK
ncbi:hypothetical protein PW035_14050, partial [Nonomuraea angiospora]|nr:hypothetical protein [Nonomuraea angiospora]